MLFHTALAEIQYRANRLACRLFGWSPAFKHTGIACRGREDCARRLRRNYGLPEEDAR